MPDNKMELNLIISKEQEYPIGGKVLKLRPLPLERIELFLETLQKELEKISKDTEVKQLPDFIGLICGNLRIFAECLFPKEEIGFLDEGFIKKHFTAVDIYNIWEIIKYQNLLGAYGKFFTNLKLAQIVMSKVANKTSPKS